MNGRPTDARQPYASSMFSPALSVARNCAHFTRNTADKYLDCSFLCTEFEIALLFPPKLGAGAIAWGHGIKLGAGAIAWGARYKIVARRYRLGARYKIGGGVERRGAQLAQD